MSAPPAIAKPQPPAISVIMPVGRWDAGVGECLNAVLRQLSDNDELIVVSDGLRPPDDLPSGAALFQLPARAGPAIARNHGAAQAGGEVLFFVDSDVVLSANCMARLRRTIQTPGFAAVFGSYDDIPRSPGLVSQFRNLLHHFQHQRSAGPVSTFFTGCGAVRRDLFLELGGFSNAYDRPAMEDVEFGLRLSARGSTINLDPELKCTHLKHWTLAMMVKVDFWDRALPWARLMLGDKPNAWVLNTDTVGRVSVASTGLLLLCLLLLPLHPGLLPLALVAWALPLGLHWRFLQLLQGRGGVRLAAAGTVLLSVHWVVGGFGFSYVCLEWLGQKLFGNRE